MTISLRQRVIDFHFGCAKGFGFVVGVDGGTIAFNIVAPAAAGDMNFSYTGTAPGTQLIVLLGTDGQYYTAVVGSAASGTCHLREPLPCDIAAGLNAWSFWDNNAHPNARGYNAMADHALRQDMAVWRKVYQRPPRVDPPATVTANATNDFGNPGSVNSNYGWTITPSGAGGGAYWGFKPARSGIYRLVFECSKGTVGTANIDLTIVYEGVIIATRTIKTAAAGRHEIDFYAPGEVGISLTRTTDAFLVSDLTILAQEGLPPASLDYGNHMVFGDSWVYDPLGPAARLAARLPNAVFSTSGVGGHASYNLIARFDADVAAVAPFDFVWLIVGTNDIASSVSAATFAQNLAVLIGKIQAIGATPILFTPFPGSTDYTARLDLARSYMASVPYYEKTVPSVTRHSLASYVPASAVNPVLSLGVRNSKFRVLGRYLSHDLTIKEATSHPATTALATMAAGYSETPITVTPDPLGRFIQIMRATGGSPEMVTGYIEIEEC